VTRVERAHLAQADRHIAEAKSYIRKQERIIAYLAATGRTTDDAQRLLDILTGTLGAFEHHRRLILHRLGR
jgi:hypothetical protein